MLNEAAAKIVTPAPPPRKPSRKDGFDLDVALTARAQKLLASGTHREFQHALRQQAADSTTPGLIHGALEPVKPSPSSHNTPSRRRVRVGDREESVYPLEWDPRAIPLLSFAESEARRALVKLEYEYRVALAAAIHSTMIQVFFTCRLDDLEHEEEVRQRRIIGAMERRGRTTLWEAQEELIITQQLREIDIPKEEIVQYLHRHDHTSSAQETEGGLLSGVSAVSEARRRRANNNNKNSSSPPASPQRAAEKNHIQEEWVLGIAYLITFDLSMEERKVRLTTLKDEFMDREVLLRERDASKEAVQVAYRNRRHGERCEHYRQERYELTTQEMFFEHVCAPLFEEWMLLTNTLMATACRVEHRLHLDKLNADWNYHVATDNLHQLEAQEEWHRHQEMMKLFTREVEWLWREHYVGRILAIAEEEARVFATTLSPWIANSAALTKHTALRLRSSLNIQVWYRSIRHNLSGWHATHRRIGADIQVMRRCRQRNRERSATLSLLEKLEELEKLHL